MQICCFRFFVDHLVAISSAHHSISFIIFSAGELDGDDYDKHLEIALVISAVLYRIGLGVRLKMRHSSSRKIVKGGFVRE